MPYLLFTWNPLYSSKSICMTLDDATDKLNDVLNMTEHYYYEHDMRFEAEFCDDTGQVKGTHILHYEDNDNTQRFIGEERKPKPPAIESNERESKYRRIINAEIYQRPRDDEEDEAQRGLEVSETKLA